MDLSSGACEPFNCSDPYFILAIWVARVVVLAAVAWAGYKIVRWSESLGERNRNSRARAMSDEVELVQVLTTEELGKYLFAKSLLEGDHIDFLVKNEERVTQDMSESRWSEGPREPVEFWVRASDADRARSLFVALRDEDHSPKANE